MDLNHEVDLDLSNNRHIECDESLEWMVEYVCSSRIEIVNTTCSISAMPMIDYLLMKFPTTWLELEESASDEETEINPDE